MPERGAVVIRAGMPRWTEEAKLAYQVCTGRARIGPEAAREIAQRIEEAHGFWDFSRLTDVPLSAEEVDRVVGGP